MYRKSRKRECFRHRQERHITHRLKCGKTNLTTPRVIFGRSAVFFMSYARCFHHSAQTICKDCIRRFLLEDMHLYLACTLPTWVMQLSNCSKLLLLADLIAKRSWMATMHKIICQIHWLDLTPKTNKRLIYYRRSNSRKTYAKSTTNFQSLNMEDSSVPILSLAVFQVVKISFLRDHQFNIRFKPSLQSKKLWSLDPQIQRRILGSRIKTQETIIIAWEMKERVTEA